MTHPVEGDTAKQTLCQDKIGKVEFVLESVRREGSCGVRLGRLVWSASSSLTTPLCLIHTRGGSTPNLTRDLEEQILQQCHLTKQQNHVTGSRCGIGAFMLTMPSLFMK